jgi:hypothetical protein
MLLSDFLNIIKKLCDCFSSELTKSLPAPAKNLPREGVKTNKLVKTSFIDPKIINDYILVNSISSVMIYNHDLNKFHGYKPRTTFGVRLMELRQLYINDGGKLLNEKELDAEILALRGGLADE